MDYQELLQDFFSRLLYPGLPFLICLNCILALDKVAPQLGLLDRPDKRKQHAGTIPLIGGPAMFLAIVASVFMLEFKYEVLIILGLGAVLVLLGILDDLYDLRASYRVIVQIIVAALMVSEGGVQIQQIGNIVGQGSVNLTGFVAIAFTIMCTIGVINAVNMIDGVDGLAGSILLVSFLAIAWLALRAQDYHSAKMLMIFSGALAGFLCFNARIIISKARIFMGDSGSMLMGFILCWYFIDLTQGTEAPVSAITAGWIFGLPLIDTVSVMVGRILQGESPFKAGRDHLHHRLLDNGFSVNGTVLIMLCIHLLFVTIGIIFNGNASVEPIMFWGFVLIVIAHHFLTPKIFNNGAERSPRQPVDKRN